MELILVIIFAFLASLATFFSGFGLGSILLPVFAIFYPAEIAVAATAIVHLSNNVFKSFIIGRYGALKVILGFGIPAFIASFFGSRALIYLSSSQPIFELNLFGTTNPIFIHKVLIGGLMLAFSILELLELNKKKSFISSLALGGIVSGFFGGFSGHQGAFRSMFLIQLKLNKEQFIATGVWIAIAVDIARISQYSEAFYDSSNLPELSVLIGGILAAFVGALLGRQLLKKVTLNLVQIFVSIGIMLISLLMILGII